MVQLQVIIPVYNEGRNIHRVLDSLAANVTTPFQVLICYDFDEDDTLAALETYPTENVAVVKIRNLGRGPHAAIISGFSASVAPVVAVLPADDVLNAGCLDEMVSSVLAGNDVVCASRFMKGGTMKGCPLLKAILVRLAAVTLHAFARLPTHDPTNGFRAFSRRILDEIIIESDQGFTYSLELLVKAHRLRWGIVEIPSQWIERGDGAGTSRFRIYAWLLPYLRWYFYAYATTYLRCGPQTVPRRLQRTESGF
jgi:dolichol-phosphate mannosyltransferase